MFTLNSKSALLCLLFIVITVSTFGQAEVRATYDTASGLPGEKRYDTLVKFGIDTTLKYITKTPYQVTIGVNPNILSSSSGGSSYWLPYAPKPTTIYYKLGNVGIGVDSSHAPLEISKTTVANTVDTGLMLSNSGAIDPTTINNYYAPGIYFQGRSVNSNIAYATHKPTMRMVPYSSSASISYQNLKWQNYDPSASSWVQSMDLQQLSSIQAGLSIGSGLSNTGKININMTANQIDNGTTDMRLGAGGTVYINSQMSVGAAGGVYQAPYTGLLPGFAANDFASLTYASLYSIADFQSRGLKGVRVPLMTSARRDSMTSRPLTYTITNAGSGYTNGTYHTTFLTTVTGVGVGAYVSVVVSGGVVTSVTLTFSQIVGKYYRVGDQLSIPALGGSGSGATVTVASITTADQGVIVNDTTTNQLSLHIGIGDNWTGRVITISTSTYNPLAYGADYIFTGSGGSYTLPAINSKIAGRQNEIHLINESSGTVTINSDTGSTLYTTSLQPSITLASGATSVLFPTGTNLKVKYNQ